MNIPVKMPVRSEPISAKLPPVRRGQLPRLLIVDDSVVVRSAIDHIVAGKGGIVVAGKVPHIDAATAFLSANRVELVLLDHEMPGQNGLEGLPAILELAQGARVAMLSGHCAQGSEIAVRALALGASDVILKPCIREYDSGFADGLVARLLRLAVPVMMQETQESEAVLRPVPPGFRLKCLGIGASTGGIHALGKVFSSNAPPPGVPILVTQHLPAHFIPYFADQLRRMTNLPVSLARSGKPLRANHIYVAPGDSSLLCVRENGQAVAVLSQEHVPFDPVPAVNPMFRSMAECFGAGAAGIVLTGMGRDGTAGAQMIVDAGGLVIAQDRASSVVWGMPGSVARSGLASALLEPEKMLEFIDAFAAVSHG
jgi:two-component system, chemotaxis family, protein-glutamate methylesterase/glutaminase